MATKTEQSTLEIKEIILETVTLRIVGETPLIMHAWSEKAKREILDKQMKATKTSAKKSKESRRGLYQVNVLAHTNARRHDRRRIQRSYSKRSKVWLPCHGIQASRNFRFLPHGMEQGQGFFERCVLHRGR